MAAPVPAAPVPPVAPTTRFPSGALTVSRIFFASSIAIAGTGEAARLTILAAIMPAIAPTTSSRAAITKKPQKYS